MILECFLLLLPNIVSFEPFFLVSVSANILDWHCFSLLSFWCRFGWLFCLQPWLVCCSFALQFGVSWCFTSASIGGELCALKRRLEAKRLALALCIIGSTLASPFGYCIVSCLTIFCSSFCIFWTPYLVPLWSPFVCENCFFWNQNLTL